MRFGTRKVVVRALWPAKAALAAMFAWTFAGSPLLVFGWLGRVGSIGSIVWLGGIFAGGAASSLQRFVGARRASTSDVSVVADPRGLCFDSRRLRRAQIRNAHVTTSADASTVSLSTGSHIFEIACGSAAEAEGLLAATNLGPTDALATFTLRRGTAKAASTGSYWAAAASACFVVASFVLAPTFEVAVGLVYPTLLVLAALRFRPAVIRVGMDGFSWPHGIVGSRFHSFRAVHKVVVERRGVTVELTSGEILSAHERERPDLFEFPDVRGCAERLAKRILEHVECVATSDEERGRPTGIVDQFASYRAQAISPEVLWKVLEDGDAPYDTRLDAARVLNELQPNAKDALRRIAEASAVPRVRVGLGALVGEPMMFEDEEPAPERRPAKLRKNAYGPKA